MHRTAQLLLTCVAVMWFECTFALMLDRQDSRAGRGFDLALTRKHSRNKRERDSSKTEQHVKGARGSDLELKAKYGLRDWDVYGTREKKILNDELLYVPVLGKDKLKKGARAQFRPVQRVRTRVVPVYPEQGKQSRERTKHVVWRDSPLTTKHLDGRTRCTTPKCLRQISNFNFQTDLNAKKYLNFSSYRMEGPSSWSSWSGWVSWSSWTTESRPVDTVVPPSVVS